MDIFLFATASRPALGRTHPPMQWVPGALSWKVKRSGVKLTAHLHLVPRLRMRGAVFMAWCVVKHRMSSHNEKTAWFVWVTEVKEDKIGSTYSSGGICQNFAGEIFWNWLHRRRGTSVSDINVVLWWGQVVRSCSMLDCVRTGCYQCQGYVVEGLMAENRVGKCADPEGLILVQVCVLCLLPDRPPACPPACLPACLPRACFAGCRFDPEWDALVPGTGTKSLTFKVVSVMPPLATSWICRKDENISVETWRWPTLVCITEHRSTVLWSDEVTGLPTLRTRILSWADESSPHSYIISLPSHLHLGIASDLSVSY
jgi:hypothetical protein